MVKIRKALAIATVITLTTAFLPGCTFGEQSDKGTKIKIGVTLYDQYDTFITQLMESFDENVEENVEVVVYNASSNQQTQNSQVKKMIQDGCNVICVNLVDRTDPSTVIDAAKKANVPIVFFNRELVEGDVKRFSKLFYVGANATESGVMEGELAADVCKSNAEIDKNGDGQIQYVVIEGEAGHQDSIVRTESSVDTMKKEGITMDKLGYAIANWSRVQAQTKMAQLIEQKGDSIELVLANNDDMALGVVDAYNAAEIPQRRRPVIFGIDGTDVGLAAVKEGDIAGTVYNDKEGQAKAMYRLAVALACGGSIDDLSDEFRIEDGKYIRLHYYKVTTENVNEFMVR